MKRLVVVVLILGFACFGCAFGRPAGESLEKPQAPLASLPFRCIKYSSKWRGKGTPEELRALENMSNSELREFLKNFEQEP